MPDALPFIAVSAMVMSANTVVADGDGHSGHPFPWPHGTPVRVVAIGAAHYRARVAAIAALVAGDGVDPDSEDERLARDVLRALGLAP